MIKDLLKNFSALAISTLGSKLLTILIIPIYTSVLSTTDIGKFDLVNTIISMAIPLLTLNVSEGVLRYLLDKNYCSKVVKTIGHKYVWRSVFIFSIATIFFYLMGIGNITLVQMYIVMGLYISDVWYNYYLREKRGEGCFKEISMAGVLNTVVCFACCILFLIVLKFGIEGYALAYILGNAIACLYLINFGQTNRIRNVIGLKKEYIIVKKEILVYSVPLIINALSWWVNDYSDRYIIIWLCGISASGIYSVAYKIPAILNVIQTIFNQAWVVSTVKAEENNNVSDIIDVYQIYKSILFIGCSCLLIFIKLIAHFLYAKDFYIAWIYTPYLITAIIYSSLSGCLGGILAAQKRTRIYALSTFSGAILNILLNFFWVNKIGVMGAAFSTLISCVWVYFIRIVYLEINKIIRLNSLWQYIIVIPLFILMFSVRFEWNVLFRVVLYVINILINAALVLRIVRKRMYE